MELRETGKANLNLTLQGRAGLGNKSPRSGLGCREAVQGHCEAAGTSQGQGTLLVKVGMEDIWEELRPE